MAAEGIAGRVKAALVGAPDTDTAIRRTVEVLHESSPRYDWTGIYLMDGVDELVLSQFLGAPTPHTRIPVGSGICGAAAAERETIVVPDVGADPRYLACSVETKSEIVVPIMKNGVMLGEIDIDSHTPDAFGPEDSRALEEIATILAARLAPDGGNP